MPVLTWRACHLLLAASLAAAADRPSEPDEGILDDGWVTDITLGAGLRTLANEGWSGLEEGFAVGLDFCTEPPDWPIAIAGGVIDSYSTYEDGNDQEWSLTLLDWYLGVRRTERFGKFDVHYGGGFVGSYIRLNGGPEGAIREREGTAGAYAEAGLNWCFAGTWTLGLRGRYQISEHFRFTLGDDSGDTDGATLLGTIGLRF